MEEQAASNQSALPHFEAFTTHRERVTDLALERAAKDQGSRLCVLGAGNCYDLDLARLAAAFREVHLVDIDRAALEGAISRCESADRSRLKAHQPLDLSGMLDRLEAWRRFQVTPSEVLACPDTASSRIASALQRQFDVVISACLLSQLQLAVLEVLGDRHRLFEAARQVQNLVHLRTLAKLLAPGGRALLVSDVVSNVTYPLESLSPDADHRELLAELVRAGNVIYAVNPELIAFTVREDPFLRRTVTISEPLRAWLWQNGNDRTFLVYAMELSRLG